MSINYRINVSGAIDGVTAVNLADSNLFTDTDGLRIVNVVTAGVFSLTPLGRCDFFMHTVSIVPTDPVSTSEKRIRGPEPIGTIATPPVDQILQPARGVAANPSYNIYFPTASSLICTVVGGAVQSGTIYFTMRNVPLPKWARLQCCHTFRPVVSAPAA